MIKFEALSISVFPVFDKLLIKLFNSIEGLIVEDFSSQLIFDTSFLPDELAMTIKMEPRYNRGDYNFNKIGGKHFTVTIFSYGDVAAIHVLITRLAKGQFIGNETLIVNSQADSMSRDVERKLEIINNLF